MLSTFTMSAGMISFQHYKSKYIQHYKQMPSWDVKNKNITYLISLVCLANNFFFLPLYLSLKDMGTGLILLYNIELEQYFSWSEETLLHLVYVLYSNYVQHIFYNRALTLYLIIGN